MADDVRISKPIKLDSEARIAFDLFMEHIRYSNEEVRNEIFKDHKKLLSRFVDFIDAVKRSRIPR